VNEFLLDWKPEWAADYRRWASEFDTGVIEWDGLLLDGWLADAKPDPTQDRLHSVALDKVL
jgi:hypothetical protein